MKEFLANPWHEERGQDTAEYALMFILVSLLVVAVLQVMEVALRNNYLNASTTLATITGHGRSGDSTPAGQPALRGGHGSGGDMAPDWAMAPAAEMATPMMPIRMEVGNSM